ncbi:MAG: hypothetical protein L3K15_02010 [Thermoplasmata archaeon]|nr:hypothetical protein [Thermoplasmata archaeon]
MLAGVAVLGFGLLSTHSAVSVGIPHGGAVAPFTKAVHPAAAPKPLAPPSPPVTVTVAITAQPPTSSDIPLSFNFSVVVTGAVADRHNLTLTVAAWEVAPSTLIANYSVHVVKNQVAYTTTVDYGKLNTQLFNGGNLPGGNYQFTVWGTMVNSTNASVATATGSATTAQSKLYVIDVRTSLANGLTLYETVPFNITFNVSITGNQGVPLRTDSAVLSVEARYIVSGCGSVFGFGGPCPSVTNVTVPVVNGTTSYTFTVNGAFLTAGGFGAATSVAGLPHGSYQVIAWATIMNASNASAEPRTGAAAHNQWLVLNPLVGAVLSPGANTTISTGNVTISVGYGGDFINGANVTVTSPSGSTVFANPVFVPGTGYRAATTVTPWVVTTPGTYTITLVVTSIPGGTAGTLTAVEKVTVVPAGGTVFQNTSSFSNQTVIPGLSGAVGGALLIVIGLIIGMIVALALGRAMWGGAKPAPAQPWTGTTSPTECPVCHQTFPTEEAMKEHSKSAHGMQ